MSAPPTGPGSASGSGPAGIDEGAPPVRAEVTLTRARTARWIEVTTQRPVAVLMVFVAVMVFGWFSIRLLPVNLMPDISYPKLTVRTEYAGAAPAEVENNVSRPLEEMLGVVTGLTRIQSVSRTGTSDVVLEFAWGTDMDDAGQDVLEAIDKVEPLFPEGVKQPLILRYDPTLDPVVTLSIRGDGPRFEGKDGLELLRRIADRDVRRMLEPIPGVAAVKVKGGLEDVVHVKLDAEQMRRTGLSSQAVVDRLAAENINLAGGTMRDGKTRYLVRTVNELRDVADIGSVVLVHRDGRDVRLSDVATFEGARFDRREEITRIDGAEGVEIEVYKEADANIVAMSSRVRGQLDRKIAPEMKKQYGATVQVASDRSGFIDSSIREVRNTAIIGGLLAVGILFVFLRDVRSTLIVAVSIPVSVLITFAPLSLANVSLNIMSLGGLAMGIGMLVDNSIVVLESIHRCRQEGDDLVAGTLRGTAEVSSAVMASTLTTIAVFFPMVFVEGVAGQMFGDLGLAVVFSLLASLAVALFLIPMLASRAGLAEAHGGPNGIVAAILATWGRWASISELVASIRAWRRRPWLVLFVPYVLLRWALHLVFELLGKVILTLLVLSLLLIVGAVYLVGRVVGLLIWPVLWAFAWLVSVLERAYPPVIRACLANRVVVYAAFLGSLAFVGWGLSRVDTELIPQLHQGEFTVEMRLPVGTFHDETDRTVAPLETAILASVPHVAHVTATIGTVPEDADTSERGPHTASLRVLLHDDAAPPSFSEKVHAWVSGRGRAEAMESEALAAIREVVADVPDLRVSIARPILFSFKTPIEVEIRGHDLPALAVATELVARRLAGMKGLRDVEGSIQPGSPEVHVIYDRDALARQGLDVNTTAEQLRRNLAGAVATRMTRGDRKVDVIVAFSGSQDMSLAEVESMVVNPGAARPVPLSAVAEMVVSRGPNEIRRIGQQRVGLVTANLEGLALGAAAERIEAELATLSLPPSITTEVTGQSEEWKTSSRSLYVALALSVFLVYVIMASQFESLVYPLVILLTIPLALVGVVGVLLVLEMPVSVVVFLGAIMLAGIVVNNAIVLVDYTGRLKARGMSTAAALEMAGRVRLRPILMTTLTTMLGLLPMAIGLGDGAEIRAPMAITVIAGLGLSTVLTLLVIPTLYAAVDGIAGGRRLGETIQAGLQADIARVTAEQLAPEASAAPVETGPSAQTEVAPSADDEEEPPAS
ncbi:MAG: efflux RND transporter permease subunit [Nannocystaceae bacterium]|nr:efflux RND transporter permease subunit [Nannocystaceae bacterium]